MAKLEFAGRFEIPCRIGMINSDQSANRSRKTRFRLQRLGRRGHIAVMRHVGHGMAGATLMRDDDQCLRIMRPYEQFDLRKGSLPFRNAFGQYQAIGPRNGDQIDTVDTQQLGYPPVQIHRSLVQTPVGAGERHGQFFMLTPPHTSPPTGEIRPQTTIVGKFIDEARRSHNGANAQNDTCMNCERQDSTIDAISRNLTQPYEDIGHNCSLFVACNISSRPAFRPESHIATHA